MLIHYSRQVAGEKGGTCRSGKEVWHTLCCATVLLQHIEVIFKSYGSSIIELIAEAGILLVELNFRICISALLSSKVLVEFNMTAVMFHEILII